MFRGRTLRPPHKRGEPVNIYNELETIVSQFALDSHEFTVEGHWTQDIWTVDLTKTDLLLCNRARCPLTVDLLAY